MEEIRSWFEVPAIAHYCYLFRAAFDLTEFEIEDFEDALVVDGSSEGTSFIPDLLARLLRGLYRTKDVTSQNYERYLNDLLDYHYVYLEKKDNPVKDIPFRSLPTKKKVEVLYDICHWRLEVDDIQELLKNNEPERIRVQPIGKDSKGSLYWYFYGTCLYKEEPLEKPSPVLNGVLENNGKNSVKLKGKKRKKKGKGRKLKSAKKKKRDKWNSDSDSDYVEESFSASSDDDSISYKKTNRRKEEEAADSDSDCIVPFQCSTKWALACSSTQEWQDLADSFKGSKSKAEKDLYQLLVEQYIDEIPKIIESKERALQRKLMQEAPRRASDRIAYKLQQQEEEERVRYLIMQEEEDKRQKEADERRKFVEEQRRKERDERAKERERIAEERRIEREKRAKQREEQKWAIENPELASELKKVVEDSKTSDKELRTKRIRSETADRDEDEYTAMFKVLDVLKKHKDAWPFLEPVDESYAPQYYDIIETPMDLAKVEEKLEKSQYTSKDEFIKDVELMFGNCLEYNGEESCYTKMANTLDRVFKKQILKEFPEDTNDSNDEDYFEDSDDPKRKKKGKKKLKGGEVFSEQGSTPVKPEAPLPQAIHPEGKRLFPQMPHAGTPNGMFPAPGLRPINALGQMLPTDVVRAQMMQQQIRLLTAMNGVLRPGAGVMPQLRPAPDGTVPGFPHGLSPHLGQLGGPMASLIGQFTRMPLSGNKNMPVNPHQLGERPGNPGGLSFTQAPMFQGMVPGGGRMEAPPLQAPPRFRMIFPPQAEVGEPILKPNKSAQNPRPFSLDQLLSRSTPAEKPSSTTSTGKTTHLASSQPSGMVKKEDEKPEPVRMGPEEEKDGPLTRKISLEESNARVQSWLDSQPETCDQDQPETPTCKEPPQTTNNPLTNTPVSSIGVAAAVAASIHNAVRQSMRGPEKPEPTNVSHSGSVLYKKNGFINLSKQNLAEQNLIQGLPGKESQQKANEGKVKDSDSPPVSKPQFFVYQEGKQPASLLSPSTRQEPIPGDSRDIDSNNRLIQLPTVPSSMPSDSNPQPHIRGLSQAFQGVRTSSPMQLNANGAQLQVNNATGGCPQPGNVFTRFGSPVPGLQPRGVSSPRAPDPAATHQKLDGRIGNFSNDQLKRSDSPYQPPLPNTQTTELKVTFPQSSVTKDLKAQAFDTKSPLSQQSLMAPGLPQAQPTTGMQGKKEGKGGVQKEVKEKKPRKPRQKKKDVAQEKNANTTDGMGMPFGMDRQRKSAVQNEVQNILAQSAQMAGINPLIVNQVNQHPSVRGMPFLGNVTKADTMALGMTRPVQLPGSNQTYFLQAPISQKDSSGQDLTQGGNMVLGQQIVSASGLKVASSQHPTFIANPFMAIPTSNLVVSMGTAGSLGILNNQRLLQPAQNQHRSLDPSFPQGKVLQSPSGQAIHRGQFGNVATSSTGGPSNPLTVSTQIQNLTRSDSNGDLKNNHPSYGQNRHSTPTANAPQFLQNAPGSSTHLHAKSSPNEARSERNQLLSQLPNLQSQQEQSHDMRGIPSSTRGNAANELHSNVPHAITSPSLMQQRFLSTNHAATVSNSHGNVRNSSSPSAVGSLQRFNVSNNDNNRSLSSSPFQGVTIGNTPFRHYSPLAGLNSPNIAKGPDVVPKAMTDRPKFLDLSKSVQGRGEQQKSDLGVNNENRVEKSKGPEPIDTRRGASVITDNRNVAMSASNNRGADDKGAQNSHTPPQHQAMAQGARAFTLGSSLGSISGSSVPFGLQYPSIVLDNRPQFPVSTNTSHSQEQTRAMEEIMQRRFLEHQRMFGLPAFQAGHGSYEEGARRNTFHQL